MYLEVEYENGTHFCECEAEIKCDFYKDTKEDCEDACGALNSHLDNKDHLDKIAEMDEYSCSMCRSWYWCCHDDDGCCYCCEKSCPDDHIYHCYDDDCEEEECRMEEEDE